MKEKQKEVRTLSGESFEIKFKKAKDHYHERRKEIDKKYEKRIANAKNSKEIKELKRKRRFAIRKQKNKYALRYNAINEHKLYRKSMLEAKKTEARAKYKNKKHRIDFDEKLEKEKLNKRIKTIKKTYSKPISSQLRHERNSKIENEIGFITVPIMTPAKRWIRSFILLFIAAFITTIALDIFIKPFGVYNAGLRGITQMIYYVIKDLAPGTSTSMSYVLFFGLNIPLALFGWFKVGKKFTILTISFIAMQFVISIILDYSGIEDLIKPFGKKHEEIYDITRGNVASNELYQYGLPFVSALMGAIIYGAGIGVIYSAGGSTGGSKFIVTWLSSKRQKSIGYFAMMISIFVITLGIIVNHVIMNHENFVSAFTSVTLFASVIFVYMSNWTLDKIFAKSQKEKIEIITSKKDQIIKFLDMQLMYNRSFTVQDVKTGIRAKKRSKMIFLVSQQESKLMTTVFRKIDPKATISSSSVSSISSRFYTLWFE